MTNEEAWEKISPCLKNAVEIEAPVFFAPTARNDQDRIVVYFPDEQFSKAGRTVYNYEGFIFKVPEALAVLNLFYTHGKEIKYGMPK